MESQAPGFPKWERAYKAHKHTDTHTHTHTHILSRLCHNAVAVFTPE